MDTLEGRIRCLEAAARNPQPHGDGYAAGIVAAAKVYWEYAYALDAAMKAASTLKLPQKSPQK